MLYMCIYGTDQYQFYTMHQCLKNQSDWSATGPIHTGRYRPKTGRFYPILHKLPPAMEASFWRRHQCVCRVRNWQMLGPVQTGLFIRFGPVWQTLLCTIRLIHRAGKFFKHWLIVKVGCLFFSSLDKCIRWPKAHQRMKQFYMLAHVIGILLTPSTIQQKGWRRICRTMVFKINS